MFASMLLWWLSDKESICQCRRLQEMLVQLLGWEDPLEKEMAAYSSILTWEVPWTEERGSLQSVLSQTVRYNWSDLTCMQTKGKRLHKSPNIYNDLIQVKFWTSMHGSNLFVSDGCKYHCYVLFPELSSISHQWDNGNLGEKKSLTFHSAPLSQNWLL